MALTHASVSPGLSAHSAKAEHHTVKRSYVPIKPAFRPLLPKPCTREPSPPNGIHIHTRATLNAGRKRLVASKSLDLHKRRRAGSHAGSSPASGHASPAAKPAGPSPEALAHDARTGPTPAHAPALDRPGPEPAAGHEPLAHAIPMPARARHLDRPATGSAAGTPSMADDGLVSPPTPISLSGSPSGVSMASLLGPVSEPTASPATIDPVCMVMGSDKLIDSHTLTPPDTQAFAGFGLLNAPSGFAAEFDEFSDFYFRGDNNSFRDSDSFRGDNDSFRGDNDNFRGDNESLRSGNNSFRSDGLRGENDTFRSDAFRSDEFRGDAGDDVVSAFVEPQLEPQQPGAGGAERADEFSILDYLAPTNDLF